jgi:hypothetical protein
MVAASSPSTHGSIDVPRHSAAAHVVAPTSIPRLYPIG